GDDTVLSTLFGGTDTVDLDGGEDGVVFFGTDKSDHILIRRVVTPAGPEVIFTNGSQSITTIYKNGETVSVFGGAGNDHIEMDSSAATWKAVFFGQDGNDHLIGSSNNDTLDGGAGNDILEGGGGNDVLISGRV